MATVQEEERRAFYRTVDLGDGAAARSFVDWGAAQLGGIDFVVSNAGRNFNVGVAQCPEANWQTNLDLNLAAHSLALEWGPHVRTVGIAPGFIDTAMNVEWFGRFSDPDAKRRQIEQLHPVGRIGTPEEVGALCAFLCSPLAGFISGTTILMDGGRSAVLQDD